MIQSREIRHKFPIDLPNCPYVPGLSGYVHYPRFILTKNRFLYSERTKNRDSSNFNRIYLMTSFRILDFRPPDVRYILTQQKHYFGSRRLSLSAFFMIDLTFCVLSFFVLCRFELLRGGFWHSWVWIAARLNFLFGSHFLFCSILVRSVAPSDQVRSIF